MQNMLLAVKNYLTGDFWAIYLEKFKLSCYGIP